MNGSSQNGGTGGPSKETFEADLSERRDRLNRMLDGRRAAEEAEHKVQKSDSSGYAQAMKLSSEFIAGVLVGAGIGWVGDYWLGTSPIGLIIFLLLGFAAGVLNVLRSVEQVEQPFEKSGPEDRS